MQQSHSQETLSGLLMLQIMESKYSVKMFSQTQRQALPYLTLFQEPHNYTLSSPEADRQIDSPGRM